MNWLRVWLALSDFLSVLLVIKLVRLKLHSAYRVFCAFLLFEILSESFVFLERFTVLNNLMDYRITWLIVHLGSWTLSFGIVYALLRDILANLPGILRFARRILNVALPVSALIALVSARVEYSASVAPSLTSNLDYVVSVALVLERLVATIAVLVLLVMLAFILWFPVKMPRNLAVFSIGFSVYFSVKATLILIHDFWAQNKYPLMDEGMALILCICLAYWITFLNKAGEQAPVIVGSRWQEGRQAELFNNLEHINATLARSGRR